MINIRSYSSKIKKTFFSGFGMETINKNNSSVPVIVVDLQTNKSVKYTSINQAARDLAAHPKTIWRKVQNKQPYLERYLIVKKQVKYNDIYINVIGYFKAKLKLLFNNYIVVLYLFLLFIFFGYIIYKYMLYMTVLYRDIYNYIYSIDKIKIDNLKFALEDKSTFYNSNNIFNYIKTPISNKVNGLIDYNTEWRSIYLLKNKNSFISFGAQQEPYFSYRLGIYESIINEINLDFRSNTNILSALNSTHSSPIIERININNIFSNAIASTRPTISIVDTATSASSNNSLVIQTQSIYNNRNYSIVDSLLMGPRSPGRELLNYNSNVLYCLINGISPSTY